MICAQFYSFACGYPIFSVSFVEETIFSTLCVLGMLVKDKLTLQCVQFFWSGQSIMSFLSNNFIQLFSYINKGKSIWNFYYFLTFRYCKMLEIYIYLFCLRLTIKHFSKELYHFKLKMVFQNLMYLLIL